VGSYLGEFGFLVQRVIPGFVKDQGQFNSLKDIFSVKSAGMLIRKDLFDLIGGFPEDFFIFLEETDLCWRVWLAGFRVVFAPHSIVYHSLSRTITQVGKEYLIYYYGTRNYVYTLAKNLDRQILIQMLLPHLLLWIGIATYFLFKGLSHRSCLILRGLLWNLKNVRRIIAKRQSVNLLRKRALPRHLLQRASFRYYLTRFKEWSS
jgi:GT2 family glycosyltransferase